MGGADSVILRPPFSGGRRIPAVSLTRGPTTFTIGRIHTRQCMRHPRRSFMLPPRTKPVKITVGRPYDAMSRRREPHSKFPF